MRRTGYLTYNAKLPDQTGKRLGPSIFGEMFVVTSQMYDANTGKTVLELTSTIERPE